jgi:hypothetical protein
MLRRCSAVLALALAWGGISSSAHAQHEHWYEFQGTHLAISVERFMGIDYVDFEGPGGGKASARLLLNADEPVPTSYARFGFDVFIKRFSIGLAGGVATNSIAVLAPRVGYLFGITPQIGIWLRGGAFYATSKPVDYFGVTAEAFFAWFPYPIFALHVGPTLDVAFANGNNRNYLALGLPEFGMTAWF